MATDEWTASTSGNWTTGTDWSGGEPGSSSDVVIASHNDITVTSPTSSVVVNTISVNATDELTIENGSNDFTITDGAPEPSFGVVNVANGNFVVGSASASTTTIYGNAGFLLLDSIDPPNLCVLFIEGSVSFIDRGTIQLSADSIISGNFDSSTLTNVDNTVVSDAGDIRALNFINQSTVEVGTGGFLRVEGTAEGGTFDNQKQLTANTGSTLFLGVDRDNATIANTGTIELENNESGFSTEMEISGNVTIACNGGGQILFSGANSDSSSIDSDGSPATLTLVGGSLSGAGGSVGDANLTLNLQDFNIVESSSANEFVVLAAAETTLDSNSSIVAENNGEIFLEGPISDGGAINIGDGGEIFVSNTITEQPGATAINIGQGGTLSLTSTGRIFGFVAFAGSDATLKLGTTFQQISNSLVGAAASDMIDLTSLKYNPGMVAVWLQGGTAGTLEIENTGGLPVLLALAGQYNSLDFVLSSDGGAGTLITVQNTPNYAENPGNNDEWILSDGNWVESAGPGSHPSGSNVALTGDWTGKGTDGILWFNPTTGDTDEWQLSNTQWAASVDLGTHPTNATDGASYQIAGTDDATDFTGNGIDDVLWTSTNSNGTIATDIWDLGTNGNWAASVSPGSHPAGYTVAATGDWTGDGTDGILWYNASNGDTDEWQLKNGQWSASVDLGSHPGSGWTIAGAGDFFGNGRDDVLWTNSTSGGVLTDIWELGTNGQWIASVSPGSHPAGYQVVGVGDFTGLGTSDILWYNASTGDTDEWLISEGQWAKSIDLGTHPGGFQIAGVGDFNGAGNDGILWHAPS
jgi:hypothetical protein